MNSRRLFACTSMLPARCLWLVFLLSVSRVSAEEKPKFDQAMANKWASVAAWEGRWEAEETWIRSWRASGGSFSDLNEDNRGSAMFTLRPANTNDDTGWVPWAGHFAWKGVGSGRNSYSKLAIEHHGDGQEKEVATIGTGKVRATPIDFLVYLDDQRVTFYSGAVWDGTVPHQTGMVSWRDGTTNRINKPDPEGPVVPLRYKLVNDPKHSQSWPFYQAPGVITFNDEDRKDSNDGATVSSRQYRSRVVLWPVFDDLECEVTIDGYADWLPEGSIRNPGQPGSALIAHAVLKSKDGRIKKLPEVEKFTFELIDTSREPGVCLNWPLGAQDDDFDLRLADFGSALSSADQMAALQKFVSDWGLSSMGDFDQASRPAGGPPALTIPQVSENGQKGEVLDPPKDQEGRPFADAAIECYDFGAKSELRVVCVLKDGREIIGLMKGEGGEQDLVRLPKRAATDWVAEKWRNDAKAGDLPASDDNEKIEGQPMNGDGFTLYEEYRGWVVGGKHRQGDPKRKDFFVLNQRGADFRGGIALFERVSQLRVHSTLRNGKEISEDERCMNRNHRAAPHRVDQHGVILAKERGGAGGLTVGVDGADGNRAFRPKFVKAIYMEGSEAGRGYSTFSIEEGQSYNLTPRDAELAWDRGVAHELLHSVGVEHHGEALRLHVDCYFQSANAPLNPTGRHRYVSRYSLSPESYFQDEAWSNDRGPEITLRWEDTRRNVFEDDLPEYERRIAEYRRGTASEAGQKYIAEVASKLRHTGKSAEWWGRYGDEEDSGHHATRVIWVGPKNGTDSGNDLCVMKYYFANAYKMTGQERAYYLIRPGTVHAGRQICRSPAGTGTNASDHQPQSRFGDAFAGRGDCFGQICPNDAIPPRKVAGD